jgi:hypothetical protein
MNLGQLLIGQIGRRSEKARSLAMLVTVTDLPGSGWKKVAESGWRNGITSLRPVSRRAYGAGGFVALRRFSQQDPRRNLLVEVLPMANSEDAEYQVRNGRSTLLRNPADFCVEEREIEGVEVQGLVDPLIWEDVYDRRGQRGHHYNVYGRIENIAFLVQGSFLGDGWLWSDFLPVAVSQARKIRDHLAIEGADLPPSTP